MEDAAMLFDENYIVYDEQQRMKKHKLFYDKNIENEIILTGYSNFLVILRALFAIL